MLEINYSHEFFVHNFVFFSQAWVNKIYNWPWVPNLAITEHPLTFRLNQCLLEYVIKPYVFVGKKNIRPFKLCLYKDSQSLKLGMSLNNGYLISNVYVDVNECLEELDLPFFFFSKCALHSMRNRLIK